MLVENDSDVIMIDVYVFKEALKSLNQQNMKQSLLKKREDLYNKYKCFQSNFETQINTYIEKKHSTTYKPRENPKYKNRLHIISTNFDDITKTKKSFKSNLNKLSQHNKSIILPKIKELVVTSTNQDLKEELFNSVWDFIRKSYDTSYIDVLQLFDETLMNKKWLNYVEKKEWYPEDYIIKNELLSTNENMYDLYCNYVTWKKAVTNLNKTWCTIHSNDTVMFVQLLEDLLSMYWLFEKKSKTHKHIVDFSLEQMFIILSNHKNQYFIDIIKSLNVSSLESSSKFIILDIIDLA